MEDKKLKHSLTSYAYENDWYFLTDLIDSFKGTGHSEKEWAKKTNATEKDRKLKKFWR